MFLETAETLLMFLDKVNQCCDTEKKTSAYENISSIIF